MSSFQDFCLPVRVLETLTHIGFTAPTPIQTQAIPVALKGQDILGSAQTGTGKTGAFGIPLMARLSENREQGALILAPTRELAAQVMKSLKAFMPKSGMASALLIGGDSMFFQLRALEKKPRLVVATPGRLNDHLKRGSISLAHMHTLVLDETDRMLDMGFGPQLESIVAHLPEDRHTMMFSATMPPQIEKLAAKYLKNPVRLAVGDVNTPVTNIEQALIHTTDANKYNQLVEELEKRDGSVIIFVKTKHGTEKLAGRLRDAEHSADAIHGDLQQRKRERVLRAFHRQEYRILVATDVAARGLDIPHIAHVINYDLPQCPEDYIHRIGRTARAGAKGSALNFVTPAERGKWKAIDRLMGGNATQEDWDQGRSRKSSSPKGRSFGGRKESFGGKDRWAGRSFNDERGEKPWRSGEDKPYKPGGFRKDRSEGSSSDRPRQEWQDRPAKPWRGSEDKPYKPGGFRKDRSEGSSSDRPRQEWQDRPAKPWRGSEDKPWRSGEDKPYKPGGFRKDRSEGSSSDRPRQEWQDRPAKPWRGSEDKPWRSGEDKPYKPGGFRKDRSEGSSSDRPRQGAWQERSERSASSYGKSQDGSSPWRGKSNGGASFSKDGARKGPAQDRPFGKSVNKTVAKKGKKFVPKTLSLKRDAL
ncbi:MAG: DEAD/DEAH box helicase [Candidatus Puniceispirillum sp.]|nr:DEAD/DEAH box helicase [Candidatus Puniceispirillum sp.]